MNRYIHVIYCDDVRNELNNKTSFIGIYGSDLFVSEMPAVLPQLFLVISVVTDAADPIESLRIVISRDDEQVAEISPSADVLAKGRQQAQANSPPGAQSLPAVYTIGAVLKIAPFPIERQGVLRVKATTEREELRGPGLRIGLAPSAKEPATPEGMLAQAPLH